MGASPVKRSKLAPQMTAERRRHMLQIKQRALELEAKYKQKQQPSESESSSSSMSTVQRVPQPRQLQQTQTFIYDSTKPLTQESSEALESPRSRPQTLQLHSNSCNLAIPSICVKPPTPLDASPSSSCNRLLGTTRRKLNNITSRIMRFEREQETLPLDVLWQDKRMLRSSTSPALLLPAVGSEQQLQRSRSFTLDEPSPALLAHMERAGQQPQQQEQQQLPQTAATTTAPRCRFAISGCSSAQSLAHLRRDTVESKAKQVQRSASSSQVDSLKPSSMLPGRRCGGHNISSPRSLQQQQQQLKQLLQRALCEADDVLDVQQQQDCKQLTQAKRQMFKDIKLAHRDRFQQLVQYQHEEQRRMQAEFDRQQKFLIEQICADISVSTYSELNSGAVSEYTSTDDLAPASSSLNDTRTLSPRDSAVFSAARKRLFDGADTESDAPSELLPLDSSVRSLQNHNTSSNSSSTKGKAKKPLQQRSQSVARKLPSPQAPKTPPARRVLNKTTPTTGKTKPQQQQQTTISKTRRSASPSRQSLPTALELQAQQQRRHEAATLLCAVTRGFLVRRLFRTEQVQRIVQTIRDTLIFVLNLHMETTLGGIDQEEPANIRLKARLLQQLCSASRTLHLIFFQTSIKERMEIIARDRKRIKTKLMALHVKQRQ
ncbi:hypothetical protein KR044_001679 [Drosophila immigrans]|nr:hypothetical protein KR044_001679 [Drosophila immigrans]